MGGFLNDLAAAYANQVGEARYGPNWREKKRQAQLANQTEAAQLANMPTPDQASERYDVTTDATRALTPMRESVGARLDLAKLKLEADLADAEWKRDPTNTANALRAAQAKRALAAAGYDEARTADPTKFRTPSAENREPRSGWSAQYGPDGKLSGYYHPAVGFRAVGTPSPGGGEPLPPGSRPIPLSATERDALALGSVPIRAGDNMRKALTATRGAEASSPMDPRTWTGPIAGRVGGAYRGAVDSSGPAGDFDQARAEARALVYALSGKQINETEQVWLDGILPRLADRGVEQQIERFDRFVNYLRQAKAAGYSDPFAVAQAQFDSQLPSAGRPEAPPSSLLGGNEQGLTPQGSPEDIADENRLMGGGGGAPPAPPSPGGERMVKYQGRIVPLSSLPPELQARVPR